MLLILVIIYFGYKIPKIDVKAISETLKHTEIAYSYLFFAFFLLFVNYYFEIQKWQLLVQKTEHRTLSQASKDVLLGSAAGLITPFMIGDFWGRTYSFSKTNKPKVLILNAFNSFTQTWTAMVLGFISLFLFSQTEQISYFSHFHFIILGIICLLCLLLLLHTDLKKKLSSFMPKKIKDIILIEISMPVKLSILVLTLLRNLTFILQYALLFKTLGINIDFQIIFIGINLILFAKTVGFGINVIGDLGIRSFLSVQFFENYNIPSLYILCITFIIWILNVIFPAFIGACIPLFARKP